MKKDPHTRATPAAPAVAAGGAGGRDVEMEDEDVGSSLLPVTLPLTAEVPWSLKHVKVSHETMKSKTALRKLVRSISSKAAVDILGETRYAALARGNDDALSAAVAGLTVNLVAQLQARRLQEDPLEQSLEAEREINKGLAMDGLSARAAGRDGVPVPLDDAGGLEAPRREGGLSSAALLQAKKDDVPPCLHTFQCARTYISDPGACCRQQIMCLHNCMLTYLQMPAYLLV